METKVKKCLSALNEIYNETLDGGANLSMTNLKRQYSLPVAFDQVLIREKIISKVGNARGTKYFWTSKTRPNIMMAEVAMEKTKGFFNKNRKPVVKVAEVRKEIEPQQEESPKVMEKVAEKLVKLKPKPVDTDKKEDTVKIFNHLADIAKDVGVSPVHTSDTEITNCKPLEVEFKLFWGLFSYKKVKN
jgi:hypothetical protein